MNSQDSDPLRTTVTRADGSVTGSIKRRWTAPVILLGLVLVIAGVAYQNRAYFTQGPLAPDVVFTSLKGERISLKALRGKMVMVNFWATSCTTCIHEMPQMVETYRRFHERGLDFIAVAMSYDPANYVLNYAETRQLPFTVALDPQDILAKSFGDVKLTPTTFLIDKDGTILKRFVGEPDFPALHRLLDQRLRS